MTNIFQQLQPYGWNDFFESHFQSLSAQGFRPGRILFESRERYRVYTAYGEFSATLSGKLRYEAISRSGLPAVGDWAALEMREQERSAVIHSILPRKTKFTRKIAGNRTEEQVITANIDFVFVMTSLNRDFNLRRLERYLTIAWNSGANPVIILSKADLCPDAGAKVIEVEKVSAGVPVHAISVWNGTGLNALSSYFQEGQTIAFVGSSGVGKSTLINHLAGKELMSIREIREHDDRGKHATTHRQLILLPQGGLIVDTPGMRELQLWDSNPADSPFTDVQYFARQCYFSDCSHRHEPGCAVRKALEEGELDSDRFLSYEKLQKELRYVAVRQDAVAKQNQRKKWKKLTRMAKDRSRWKRM